MFRKRPPTQTADAPRASAARSFSILVADDDPWMLELLKRSLRQHGHHIVGSANNGQDALELARQLRPELVFLDIDMPKLDGIQAARAIQESGHTRIIFSTGSVDEATLERLRELKVGAYLVKPFSPGQLKAAIHLAMLTHEAPAPAA